MKGKLFLRKDNWMVDFENGTTIPVKPGSAIFRYTENGKIGDWKVEFYRPAYTQDRMPCAVLQTPAFEKADIAQGYALISLTSDFVANHVMAWTKMPDQAQLTSCLAGDSAAAKVLLEERSIYIAPKNLFYKIIPLLITL